MVDAYNDNEELNRLREWWHENGVALMLGLAIAVIAVAAWQFWHSYTASRSASASAIYAAMQTALSNNDLTAATEQAETLTSAYSHTPYAALANLMLARAEVETNKYDKAVPQLQWVMQHADDEGVAAIATLRLARVQWSLADYSGALKTLAGKLPGSFTAMAEELRGDVLRAQGQVSQANAAYTRALQAVQKQDAAVAKQVEDTLKQKIADTESVS